jgi:hypothetical protein
MSTFFILYEQDDTTTAALSINAENIEECKKVFNQSIGGWSVRVIDYIQSPPVVKSLLENLKS